MSLKEIDVSLNDFDDWRIEVSYLLKEYINSKQTYKLALDQINRSGSVDSRGIIPVIEVLTYYKVVKIIGELKSYFSDRNLRIFLRGQENDFGYLQLPRIFRTQKNNHELIDIIKAKFDFSTNNSPWKILLTEQEKVTPILKKIDFLERKKELEEKIRGFQQINISTFKAKPIPNMLAWESIMQHYGKDTRYLDLVESIPIALWFASKFNTESRISIEEVNDDDYGYIFIYGVIPDKQVAKGVWDGPYQRLINLSEATSPLSLRPHMQSAFSLYHKRSPVYEIQWDRNPQLAFLSAIDYSKFLLCIFKIRQKDILKWLCVEIGDYYHFPLFLLRKYLFPPHKEDSFKGKLNDFDRIFFQDH